MPAPCIRQQDCFSDEPRKPKDHGKEFCSEDTILVSRGFELDRGYREVGECENCPDGAEEEVVVLCRRVPPVADDEGHEAEDDDAEQALGGAKG